MEFNGWWLAAIPLMPVGVVLWGLVVSVKELVDLPQTIARCRQRRAFFDNAPDFVDVKDYNHFHPSEKLHCQHMKPYVYVLQDNANGCVMVKAHLKINKHTKEFAYLVPSSSD